MKKQHLICALILAAVAARMPLAFADTFSSSYTQDGGTLVQVDTSVLQIASPTGTPLLRLINGAKATALQVRVGSKAAQGDVRIESGSQLTGSQITTIGYGGGSYGTMTVTGADSSLIHLQQGGVIVGELGSGVLRIQDGGTISGSYLSVGVGEGTSGQAFIDGPQSKHTRNMAAPIGNPTSNIGVGRSASGSVNVSNGGLLETFNIVVGSGSDQNRVSNGSLVVSGPGSRLDAYGATIGGANATGTLELNNGATAVSESLLLGTSLLGNGKVTIDASQWDVRVPGAGYRGPVVGNQGSGEITIRNGGVLKTGGGTVGLSFSASLSTVTVSGAGSLWDGGKENLIVVGGGGNVNQNLAGGRGALNILNGAQVISEGARLGNGRGGDGAVVVSGSGSLWNTKSTFTERGAMHIGTSTSTQIVGGSGSLQILAGGKVLNDDAYIGAFAGSSGSVLVSGAGSVWTNDGSLFIGGTTTRVGGSSTLSIANGGTVSTRSTGRLLVRSPGEVFVDSQSALNVGSGGVLVDGGLLSNNGSLTGNVTVQNGGQVVGSGQFQALAIGNNGVVSPGNSPGLLTTTSADWGIGGVYLWEIASFGGAGVGWDLWQTGTLTLPSSGSFTIKAATIDLNSESAPLAVWSSSLPASWLIATSTNGAFTTDALTRLNLDTASFVGGEPERFSLKRSADSRNLFVVFDPVPEPSTLLLAACGLGVLVGVNWNTCRNRRSRVSGER